MLEIDDDGQHVWIGDNAFAIYSIFAGGDMVAMALASRDEDAGDAYGRSVLATEIRRLFHGWPSHLLRAIEEVYWLHSVTVACFLQLCFRCPVPKRFSFIPKHRRELSNGVDADHHAQMYLGESEIFALYPWEHKIPAHTYAAGPICVIGDAAHAMTPC